MIAAIIQQSWLAAEPILEKEKKKKLDNKPDLVIVVGSFNSNPL